MCATAVLAGCAYDEDETRQVTLVRHRPVYYRGGISQITLGRRVADARDLQVEINARRDELERRRVAEQSQDEASMNTPYVHVVPPPPPERQPGITEVPGPGVATEPEPLQPPVRPSPPPPIAEHSRPKNVPIAVPVPGKPGYVTSPFTPNAGYIDVTGMAPGTEAKDPYSGKVFRVP